jgi:hypothetical protein
MTESLKLRLIECFRIAENAINYEEILKFMTESNWCWGFLNPRVPNINEMKEHLNELFRSILESDNFNESNRCMSGGFYINIWNWDGELEMDIGFSLTESSASIGPINKFID